MFRLLWVAAALALALAALAAGHSNQPWPSHPRAAGAGAGHSDTWPPPPPPLSCSALIDTVTCPQCNGGAGCADADSCVSCAYNYRSGHGYHSAQPVTSSCPSGLEQIREVCNATRGRKASPVVATAAGQVQGFVDPDSAHAAFRGIPYVVSSQLARLARPAAGVR